MSDISDLLKKAKFYSLNLRECVTYTSASPEKVSPNILNRGISGFKKGPLTAKSLTIYDSN